VTRVVNLHAGMIPRKPVLQCWLAPYCAVQSLFGGLPQMNWQNVSMPASPKLFIMLPVASNQPDVDHNVAG